MEIRELKIGIAIGLAVCLSAVAGLCQGVEVVSGLSPMDGSTWVRMEVRSIRGYKDFVGSIVTPTIGIECHQIRKKRSFVIRLTPGPLDTARVDIVIQTLPYGDRLLLTKVGNDKPRWHSWRVLTDEKTYEYIGIGESGMNAYPPSKFLKDILANEQMLVEFHPYRLNGDFTAEFEIGGLREEFEKHQECTAK